MKTEADKKWDRLASAALDTREALRRLNMRINDWLQTPCERQGDADLFAAIDLLRLTRDILEVHSGRLTRALKHPESACRHDHLNMEGICHSCGRDCRSG